MAGFTMNARSRGFVLSFATFSLALFLILFAQAQYTHIQLLQLDARDVYQQTGPGAILKDVALDLNSLIGTPIRVDQNQDTAIFTVSGRTPSVLSLQENLSRYQPNVSKLGRDLNTSIFLDLNTTMNDGNFWGRTNHGLRWRTDFDTNMIRVEPTESSFYPRKIDINVFSEIAYDTINVITGACCISDTHFFEYSINYTDTNDDHAYSTSGIFPAHSSISLILDRTLHTDGNSQTGIRWIQIGNIEGSGSALPMGATISGFLTNSPIQFSIAFTLPNDSNGTKAGYDLNTTIRGSDFNVDTNTIWVTGV